MLPPEKVKRCLSRMSGKLSRTVLRRGRESNLSFLVEYTSDDFRKILRKRKAVQSMSRKGNCWDNAVAESFFHTLKTRLTHHRRYKTINDLNRDLYWYIEIYYNRVRKHSANNWLTPEDKDNRFYRNENTA